MVGTLYRYEEPTTPREKFLAALDDMGVRIFDKWTRTRGTRWSRCPFDTGLGLHFANRSLYVAPDQTDIANLIHEAGHVVVAELPPGSDASEESWYWWEAAVALWLGVMKEAKAADYALNGRLRIDQLPFSDTMYDDLRDVRMPTYRRYAKAARLYGQQRGLLDDEGRPCMLARNL